MGLPGPTNLITRVGQVTLSSGSASVLLTGVPLTANPLIVCYTTLSLASPVSWLVVSDGFSSTSPWCALSEVAGEWRVGLHNYIQGWFYAVVAVW